MMMSATVEFMKELVSIPIEKDIEVYRELRDVTSPEKALTLTTIYGVSRCGIYGIIGTTIYYLLR